MSRPLLTNAWISAECMAVLRRNMVWYSCDPLNWLRDNFPTLAKYA